MPIKTELQAPTFLVAVPQLQDSQFQHAVVLIVEHNDEGSMGFIINRPSAVSLRSFYASQNVQAHLRTEGKLYYGGPVQDDRAFLLHDASYEGPETQSISAQVKMSYAMPSLRALASTPPQKLRIFLGYAGWGPEQLAEEIKAGIWLLGEPDYDLLFAAPPERVWEAALRAMGIEAVQLIHSGAVH